MASSLPCNIPYVLNLVAKNVLPHVDLDTVDVAAIEAGAPMPMPSLRILDVGCGWGKWGFLLRDTFDVMMGQKFEKPWQFEIVGIEPFAPCITSIQESLYDEIIRKDVFDALGSLERFDLVIIGDVIEHFEKDRGHELLSKLLTKSDSIILSTPNGFMPQGAWAGNEREVHRSGWTIDDLERYNVVEHQVIKDTLLEGTPFDSGIELIVAWITAT